jgi:hypothetical protein
MTSDQVSGPLLQFQSSQTNQDETLKVVRSINAALGEDSVPLDVLEDIFQQWWPRLQSQLENLPPVAGLPPRRDPLEMQVEILENTRALMRGFAAENSRFLALGAPEIDQFMSQVHLRTEEGFQLHFSVNVRDMLRNLQRHGGQASMQQIVEGAGGPTSNENAFVEGVQKGLFVGTSEPGRFQLTDLGHWVLAAMDLSNSLSYWNSIMRFRSPSPSQST